MSFLESNIAQLDCSWYRYRQNRSQHYRLSTEWILFSLRACFTYHEVTMSISIWVQYSTANGNNGHVLMVPF